MARLVIVLVVCKSCPHHRPEDDYCQLAAKPAAELRPFACPNMGADSTLVTIRFDPAGQPPTRPDPAVLSLPALGPWPASGRGVWDEIHGRARDYAGDTAAELAWHAANYYRLPCGLCQTEYAAWIKSLPGELATAASYQRATWIYHNAVNARRGIAELSFESAAAKHGWPVEDSSTP